VLRHGRYSSLNESKSSFLPVLPLPREVRDRGLSSIGSLISCLELIKTNTRPARAPRPPLVVYPSENIFQQMNKRFELVLPIPLPPTLLPLAGGLRSPGYQSLDRATLRFHSALFISGHLARHYNAFNSIEAQRPLLDFVEPSSVSRGETSEYGKLRSLLPHSRFEFYSQDRKAVTERLK